MRKVVLAMQVSLDGFTVGPNGEMDWISVDDQVWEYVNDQLRSVDTFLLGRVTYQQWEYYWPAALTNPSSTKNEIEFSRLADKTQKIVFSRTLKKVDWKNTRLVKENIAEEIAKLKRQPGKDLIIFGSSDLAVTLIQDGLIDEYRIMVNPVVLGNGKPLFKGIKDKLNLRLINARKFKSGNVLLYYESTKEKPL